MCACLVDGQPCSALLDAGNAGDDGHGNSYDFNSGCCSRLCGPGGICRNFDAAVVANSSNAGFAQVPGASCSTGYDCGADGAEELASTSAECLKGSCCRPPSVACGSDTDCCLGHCQNDACACQVDGQPCPALFADAGTNPDGDDTNFGCCSGACNSHGLCTSGTAAVATGSNAGFSPLPGASCSTAYDCQGELCLKGTCCRRPSQPCASNTDCCQGNCQDGICGCLVAGQPCPALFADAGSFGNGYDFNLGCCSASCGSNGLCANMPE